MFIKNLHWELGFKKNTKREREDSRDHIKNGSLIETGCLFKIRTYINNNVPSYHKIISIFQKSVTPYLNKTPNSLVIRNMHFQQTKRPSPVCIHFKCLFTSLAGVLAARDSETH